VQKPGYKTGLTLGDTFSKFSDDPKIWFYKYMDLFGYTERTPVNFTLIIIMATNYSLHSLLQDVHTYQELLNFKNFD
jgi:hypothetical protein